MGDYRAAVNEILEEIAAKIPEPHKKTPVTAYIVGGVATYLHTRARASDDIDMIISHHIDLPQNLFVVWIEEGKFKKLYYDHNYNDTLGIMHVGYPSRAIHYKTLDDKFEIYILHPIDIIISKLTRCSEKDMEDIRSLIHRCNVDKEQLIELAEDAIKVGVGFRPDSVRIHLGWVLEIFDEKRGSKL